MRSGDLAAARDHWTDVLRLLPPSSQRHSAVRDRIAEQDRRPVAPRQAQIPTARPDQDQYLRLDVGLLRRLWSRYGWPLALGLMFSTYIREMGHVAMLRSLGVDAGAPMFIPGVGALVMLKQACE